MIACYRSPVAVMRLRIGMALSCAVLFATLARADSPYDGQWKQSPLKEDFTVQQWLAGCGPAPVSHSTGGGESIAVTQEGDELSFVGGGRVFKSNQCYDDMPTLVRESHSRDPSGKQWRTHCATPAGDPRRTTMNTLVAITSDTHIDIIETGRYEISLKDGKCTADVKRARGFELVKATTPVASVAPPPTTTATVAAAKVCDHIGEPARLEVRPSRKLMKTGDAFAFNAVVLDANGCATQTKTTWAVENGAPGLTVDASGLVSVAADAPEGNAIVVVTAAGKNAKVTVEVTSPANYANMLATSGLNSSGESDAASTAVIASSSLGTSATHAEDSAKKRRTIFIAVVAGLTVLLGVLAIIGMRRSKKAERIAREAEERHAERAFEHETRQRALEREHQEKLRAHEESVKRVEEAKAKRASTMECPSCRREYPAASQFCPHDGSKLISQATARAGAPLGNVCPVCKRGYDAQTKVCPKDGEELVPQAAFHASAHPAGETLTKPKGKICPTCGGRFEGEAAFCGKDGTALVLLN